MKSQIKPIALAVSVASTALLPSYAFSAEGMVIEEITVTASKRGEENLQSVPASIFALAGDSFEEKGQLDFEDFAGSVPGLQFQDLGPGDKEYIIRGVNGNGPSVVGAYFDEFVITATDNQDGGGKNAPIKLIDLERIEVLNGPQGTLYGANSMAGNIRFIPKKPDTAEFDAFVEVDVSDTDEGGDNNTISGMVNIPLVEDVLGVRLVGWRTDNSGWIDQPRREITVAGVTSFDGDSDDINDEETTGGRINLRWTPNDRFTLDLMYLDQDTEVGGSSRFTAKGSPAWPDQPAEIAMLPGNTGFAPLAGLPSLTPGDDFINSDITVNTRDDEVTLFGLTAQYEFDAGTWLLSAGRFEHDIELVFDSTPILLFFGVPAPGVTVQPQSYEIDMFETRFASSFDGAFNFVAGLYYQKDENNFEVNVVTTDGNGNPQPWDPLDANDFFGGGTTFFGRFRADEIEQKAAFGEVTFDLNDQWQLLFGVRYFEVDLESVQANLHNFGGGASIPAGRIIGTTVKGNSVGLIEDDDDQVTTKLTLTYNPSEDVMLYATYSEGFRVGGVNNSNQPFAAGIPATYESDELTNIEFGLKSRLMGGRVQANGALFFISWDDIQVEPRDPAGNIPFTVNGGEAEINGFEWSITALLTDAWKLDFTGTYFFSHELTEDQPVLPGSSPFVIVGLDGDDIPNVPDYQFYTALTYDTEVGGRPLTLVGDLTYRDETNTEFRDGNAFNIALDSYTILNLRANYDLNENITISAYVKNLTDEVAVYDGIGTFQDPESIVAARPRTIGLGFKWRM